MEILLANARERLANPSLQLIDVVPWDPVEYFNGYNKERKPVMTNVISIRVITQISS